MGPVYKMKKIFILFLNIFFFYDLSFSQEEIEIFDLACITNSFTKVENSDPETFSSNSQQSFKVGFNEYNDKLVIVGCGLCAALGTYKENGTKYNGKCRSDDGHVESYISIDRVTGSFLCMLTFFKNGLDDISAITVSEGICDRAQKKF